MQASDFDDTPIWKDPKNRLTYAPYSQRSDVFRCTAEWHMKRPEFLKSLGKFNKNLTGGPGWVISLKKREEFLTALGDGPLSEPPINEAEAGASASADGARSQSPVRAKAKAKTRVRVQAPPPAEVNVNDTMQKVGAISELMTSLLADVTVDGQRVELGDKLLFIGTSATAVSDMAERQHGKRLTLWLESETGALAVLK